MRSRSLSMLDRAIRDYKEALEKLKVECGEIADLFERVRECYEKGNATLADLNEIRPKFYHAYFLAAEAIAYEQRIKTHSGNGGR